MPKILNLDEKGEGWFFARLYGFAEKIAIICNDKKYSYADLVDAVNVMKEELIKNNIKAGNIVALLSDYSFRTISLFLALFENRNIIVPIVSKVPSEIEEKLKESYAEKRIYLDDKSIEVKSIINTQRPPDLIRALRKEMNSGLVLFSSGSEDRPKAMLHNLDNLVRTYKFRKERDSNILIFLIFDHIGGLNTLFNAMSSGSTLVIPEERGAEYICRLIAKHKVNLLPASPSFLNLILISKAYEQYDLTSLKMITYGTEPMPETMLAKLQSIFSGTKFLQTFGTSETGIAKTFSKSCTSTFFKIEDPNLKYKIVDNELWLRSKTQVIGYLNYKMDNFTDSGWFKTGDLVKRARGGYIRIIGRSKDVVNVGGAKVLPQEVESVLLGMPIIEDAVVYGEKNIITGQYVAADIVLKDGRGIGDVEREIRNFCRDKIDGYKIPVKINIVKKINYGERFKKVRRGR